MATSREPSPALSSGGDTIDDQPEDVKPSLTDLDQADPSTPEAASNLTPGSKPPRRSKSSASKKGKARKSGPSAHVWVSEGGPEGTEDEGSVASFSRVKKSEETPDPNAKTIGTSVGTRRQANGTIGSVYSGNKIKHIKKEDGTPLWRKEIQYDFLRFVIEDNTPVFTRFSDGEKGFSFADIYIDCLAKKQQDKQSPQRSLTSRPSGCAKYGYDLSTCQRRPHEYHSQLLPRDARSASHLPFHSRSSGI